MSFLLEKSKFLIFQELQEMKEAQINTREEISGLIWFFHERGKRMEFEY